MHWNNVPSAAGAWSVSSKARKLRTPSRASGGYVSYGEGVGLYFVLCVACHRGVVCVPQNVNKPAVAMFIFVDSLIQQFHGYGCAM